MVGEWKMIFLNNKGKVSKELITLVQIVIILIAGYLILKSLGVF